MKKYINYINLATQLMEFKQIIVTAEYDKKLSQKAIEKIKMLAYRKMYSNIETA